MAVYGQEAAYLVFQHADDPALEQACCIYANEQFNIGRHDVQELLGIEDRCVSKHHLSIHCVKWNDDEEKIVAPMVWVRVLSNNAIIFNRHGLDDNETGGIMVDKDGGDFLLNPGDTIQLTSKIRLLFTMPTEYRSKEVALDAGQRAEVKIFAHRFQLSERVLGFGGYAKVYVANHQKTGRQLACKVVKQIRPRHNHDNDIRSSKKNDSEVVAREFNVLKKLSHPNIISLEAVITTPYNVYIFQDLITGGDLMSHVDKIGQLSQPQTAIIIRQLLEAVKYLHFNQIAHRDIKPENILLTSWKDGGRIVLTDFGQSRTIEDFDNAVANAGASRMQSLVGTIGYVAPEIMRQHKQAAAGRSGYSQAVDIWSVGCVTSTLLSHDVLFPDERDISTELSRAEYDQCMEKINSGRDWLNVHRRAKDFIKGCLRLDENERFTATQALASEWLTHPHYRAEMDAAYKRAIAGWRPKDYDEEELIWHIDSEMHVKQAEEVRSEHFSRPRQHSSELHASPASQLGPKSAPQHRRESDDQSTFLPAPPRYNDDEHGNDSFPHLSVEDCEVPAQQFVVDSVSTCPPPPPFSPRKQVCR